MTVEVGWMKVRTVNRSALPLACQASFIAGWRIRKHFFLMANRKHSKTKKLLSWVSYNSTFEVASSYTE